MNFPLDILYEPFIQSYPVPKSKEELFVQARLDGQDKTLFERLLKKLKLRASDVIRVSLREKAEREGVRA